MKLRLFGFFACLYMLLASKEPPWADAHIMYETAASLVDHHTLAIDHMPPDPPFRVILGKIPDLNAHYQVLSVDFWMLPWIGVKGAALWASAIAALLLASVIGFGVSLGRARNDGRI